MAGTVNVSRDLWDDPTFKDSEMSQREAWIACPPTRNRWDGDGLEGALKAARDTIARALGVDDSRFDARVERGDPCRDGGVIVVMEVI